MGARAAAVVRVMTDVLVPASSPAAVVAASRNPDAAKFLAFMGSPRAAAIFRKYGFVVLPKR